MPTDAQSKKLARLTAGPDPVQPIPTVPELSDKLVTGSTEEKLAALHQFNQSLTDFFKKTGTIANR